MEKYILSVLVENHSGVLSKISGLFTRRGYNIDSLSVSITEDPSISRMTIVLQGDAQITEQIVKQLNKLIDVIKILELNHEKNCFQGIGTDKSNCRSKQKVSSYRDGEYI